MEQMEVLNLVSAILGKSDNNPLHLEMGARVVVCRVENFYYLYINK